VELAARLNCNSIHSPSAPSIYIARFVGLTLLWQRCICKWRNIYTCRSPRSLASCHESSTQSPRIIVVEIGAQDEPTKNDGANEGPTSQQPSTYFTNGLPSPLTATASSFPTTFTDPPPPLTSSSPLPRRSPIQSPMAPESSPAKDKGKRLAEDIDIKSALPPLPANPRLSRNAAPKILRRHRHRRRNVAATSGGRIWLAEGRLEALSSILSRRTARFNVCLDSRLNGRQESLGSGQSAPRFGARPPQATGWYGMVLHRRTTARPNTRLQKINAYIHY
jgi:hypothetical protein